jgi:hypothetical protein
MGYAIPGEIVTLQITAVTPYDLTGNITDETHNLPTSC